MKTLFARNHCTIYPNRSVFLAGPTPPDGTMRDGWRRAVIERLEHDYQLPGSVAVVAPEPETGNWADILCPDDEDFSDRKNDQLAWETQYLQLCNITAFWLPTYWDSNSSGCFPNNIGPTTRWEFGFMLQKYLMDRNSRSLIIGGPDDAQSIGWVRHMMSAHNLPWHSLAVKDKSKLVCDSFVAAIADAVTQSGNEASM